MEALSNVELLALLDTARAHRERDWVMILVGYWHGLRASEVVKLQRDNVKDGHITVARLKGSLRTVQPLIEDENPLLNERKAVFDFVRNLHGNQRLFPITRQHFWRLIQRHAKAAGIPARKRHPHILKHSIAMQTIHSAGIENVRQYLGHKSISSTGAYLKVSDADAASAIRKATRGSVAV
jgi:integrase